MGAGETGVDPATGEVWGKWLSGLSSDQVFRSRQRRAALRYVLKELDSNGDGKINDCDDEADIRITGYSWGGLTAVKLAGDIATESEIQSTGQKHRRVRLGLLDPVSTGRSSRESLSGNVYFALDIYQRNGCFGDRCPGPSSWYRGFPVTGLKVKNYDVSGDHPPVPNLDDTVPVNLTPDHVHMMLDYNGYASKVGLVLWAENLDSF